METISFTDVTKLLVPLLWRLCFCFGLFVKIPFLCAVELTTMKSQYYGARIAAGEVTLGNPNIINMHGSLDGGLHYLSALWLL